jgi:nucleotide-binding universal stress UspA family protein
MGTQLLVLYDGKKKMKSITRILVPVDFSPRSGQIVRSAMSFAQHFGARITLLHVVLPFNPAWTTFGNGIVLDELLERDRLAARNRLDSFLEDELRDCDVERILTEGDPAEMISCASRAQDVGLIMMATRGCGRFRRFILGSVAAKVLHDAPCPVWTSSHISEGRSFPSALPKIIVCAIDLTQQGEAILKWASEFAAQIEARLIAVHAIPYLEFRPETYFFEADMRRARIGEAQEKLAKLLHGLPAPEPEVRVDGGRINTVVRSVAEDCQADLLIIGRGSEAGMLGRLRTHSYELIRESPCPVISI